MTDSVLEARDVGKQFQQGPVTLEVLKSVNLHCCGDDPTAAENKIKEGLVEPKGQKEKPKGKKEKK